MRRILFLIIGIAITISACGTPPTYPGLALDALEGYQSTFQINFIGDANWSYLLVTNKNETLTEYTLRVEGVEKSKNPGDIRMVTDGTTSWMTGPGTDFECFLFPNSLDLGPSFLTPDNLIRPNQISESLVMVGEENLLGFNTTHYLLDTAQLDRWQSLVIDLWQTHDEKVTLRYFFQGVGNDPLFDFGNGQIFAVFTLNHTLPQPILPVEGCLINFPLPEDISNLSRFPNLISFETDASMADMSDFYNRALLERGWQIGGDPLVERNTIRLLYFDGNSTLVVNLIDKDGVTTVQLLEE